MAECGAASKLSIRLAVHLGREGSLPGRVEGRGQHLPDGGRSAPCIPWMLISRHVWTLTHPGQHQRWGTSSEDAHPPEDHPAMPPLALQVWDTPHTSVPRAHGLGSPSEMPIAQGGESPALEGLEGEELGVPCRVEKGIKAGVGLGGGGGRRNYGPAACEAQSPGGPARAGAGLARAPAGDVAGHGQQGPCGCIQSPYPPPAF